MQKACAMNIPAVGIFSMKMATLIWLTKAIMSYASLM